MKGELEVKDMVNDTSETMFPGNDQSDASIRAYFTQYENGGTLFLILRNHMCIEDYKGQSMAAERNWCSACFFHLLHFHISTDTYVTVDHVRARIIRPNICVKNGLVHVVDSILGVPLYSIYDFIENNEELE